MHVAIGSMEKLNIPQYINKDHTCKFEKEANDLINALKIGNCIQENMALKLKSFNPEPPELNTQFETNCQLCGLFVL